MCACVCVCVYPTHRWLERKDAQDMRALVDGIRNGFKRPGNKQMIGGEVRPVCASTPFCALSHGPQNSHAVAHCTER